jgi:hypothetical protein
MTVSAVSMGGHGLIDLEPGETVTVIRETQVGEDAAVEVLLGRGVLATMGAWEFEDGYSEAMRRIA